MRDVKSVHITQAEGAAAMSTTDTHPPADWRRDRDRPSWARQAWSGLQAAIGWLDERGKGAWIVATVAAFFVAPPLGVALLLFMLGTGRMFSSKHRHGHAMTCGSRRDRMESWRHAKTAMRPSGNRAFDAYKAETLRRLEDEQASFEEFLARLREAKDKAEFDQFMDERARKAQDRTNGTNDEAA
jgi:hypothetical protein